MTKTPSPFTLKENLVPRFIALILSLLAITANAALPDPLEVSYYCPRFPATAKVEIVDGGWQIQTTAKITKVYGPKWTRSHQWEQETNNVVVSCGIKKDGAYTSHFINYQNVDKVGGGGATAPLKERFPADSVLSNLALIEFDK